MRRVALLFLLFTLEAASTAGAATITTYDVPSRWVDPAAIGKSKFEQSSSLPPRQLALKANVFLPDGYDPHSKQGYPLLLLLHGHGDSYQSWGAPVAPGDRGEGRGDLLNVAKGFPGVIVMPDGDHGWYTNWFGSTAGKPQWERYHLEELLPWVKKHFRIRAGRRWHALAGMSMGGEGAMFYASQLPGYFGSAASFSGTVSIQRPEYQEAFDASNKDASSEIWGDPREQAYYWDGHDPTKLAANLSHTRLYLTTGDGTPQDAYEVKDYFGDLAEAEIRQQNLDFLGALRQAQVPATWAPHPGTHHFLYWRSDLANAIRWGLFGEVPEKPSTWSYRTVAQFGRMWGLRFGFAKAPREVESFSLKDNVLTASGSGTVTIRVLGIGRRGRFTAELPFKRELPNEPRLTPKPRKR